MDVPTLTNVCDTFIWENHFCAQISSPYKFAASRSVLIQVNISYSYWHVSASGKTREFYLCFLQAKTLFFVYLDLYFLFIINNKACTALNIGRRECFRLWREQYSTKTTAVLTRFISFRSFSSVSKWKQLNMFKWQRQRDDKKTTWSKYSKITNRYFSRVCIVVKNFANQE